MGTATADLYVVRTAAHLKRVIEIANRGHGEQYGATTVEFNAMRNDRPDWSLIDSSEPRNPQLRPVAGDVLEDKNGNRREVGAAPPSAQWIVVYALIVPNGGSVAAGQCCTLSAWRAWAAGARVINAR
jgi:hypothetical protein